MVNNKSTAKWIICNDGYYPYCSECHYEPKEITPFCPNCGAKMELMKFHYQRSDIIE